MKKRGSLILFESAKSGLYELGVYETAMFVQQWHQKTNIHFINL